MEEMCFLTEIGGEFIIPLDIITVDGVYTFLLARRGSSKGIVRIT